MGHCISTDTDTTGESKPDDASNAKKYAHQDGNDTAALEKGDRAKNPSRDNNVLSSPAALFKPPTHEDRCPTYGDDVRLRDSDSECSCTEVEGFEANTTEPPSLCPDFSIANQLLEELPDSAASGSASAVPSPQVPCEVSDFLSSPTTDKKRRRRASCPHCNHRDECLVPHSTRSAVRGGGPARHFAALALFLTNESLCQHHNNNIINKRKRKSEGKKLRTADDDDILQRHECLTTVLPPFAECVRHLAANEYFVVAVPGQALQIRSFNGQVKPSMFSSKMSNKKKASEGDDSKPEGPNTATSTKKDIDANGVAPLTDRRLAVTTVEGAVVVLSPPPNLVVEWRRKISSGPKTHASSGKSILGGLTQVPDGSIAVVARIEKSIVFLDKDSGAELRRFRVAFDPMRIAATLVQPSSRRIANEYRKLYKSVFQEAVEDIEDDLSDLRAGFHSSFGFASVSADFSGPSSPANSSVYNSVATHNLQLPQSPVLELPSPQNAGLGFERNTVHTPSASSQFLTPHHHTMVRRSGSSGGGVGLPNHQQQRLHAPLASSCDTSSVGDASINSNDQCSASILSLVLPTDHTVVTPPAQRSPLSGPCHSNYLFQHNRDNSIAPGPMMGNSFASSLSTAAASQTAMNPDDSFSRQTNNSQQQHTATATIAQRAVKKFQTEWEKLYSRSMTRLAITDADMVTVHILDGAGAAIGKFTRSVPCGLPNGVKATPCGNFAVFDADSLVIFCSRRGTMRSALNIEHSMCRSATFSPESGLTHPGDASTNDSSSFGAQVGKRRAKRSTATSSGTAKPFRTLAFDATIAPLGDGSFLAVTHNEALQVRAPEGVPSFGFTTLTSTIAPTATRWRLWNDVCYKTFEVCVIRL